MHLSFTTVSWIIPISNVPAQLIVISSYLRNSYRDGSAAEVSRTGDVMTSDLTLSIDDDNYWMLGCSVNNIRPVITCFKSFSCYVSNTIFFSD